MIQRTDQPACFIIVAHAPWFAAVEHKFANRFDEEVDPFRCRLFERIVDRKDGFGFFAIDFAVTPAQLAQREQLFLCDMPVFSDASSEIGKLDAHLMHFP